MQKVNFSLLVIFIALFVAINKGVSETRVWTDKSGRKLTAELVESSDTEVKLKRANGAVATVKISQLSPEDQDFLKQNAGNSIENNIGINAQSQTDAPIAEDGPVKVEIQAIAIKKPLPNSDSNNETQMHMQMWSGSPDGTTVTLLLTCSDATIIEMDEKTSKITSFTDDKQNNLQKQGRAGFTPAVNEKLLDENGGKWILIDFNGYNRPTIGANKVKLTGTVGLLCGTGSKELEFKDVSTKKGTISVDGQKIEIKENANAGDNMGYLFLDSKDAKPKEITGIGVVSKVPLSAFRQFVFCDSKGKELDYDYGGSMRGMFGPSSEYTTWFMLAGKHDTIIIKVEAYEKTEIIEVPINKEVPLGF
ncbi:MAG: SHD1 domain-containing protein [Thermoguttaceae bacterium]